MHIHWAVTSFSECTGCFLSTDGDRDLKILQGMNRKWNRGNTFYPHLLTLFCHILNKMHQELQRQKANILRHNRNNQYSPFCYACIAFSLLYVLQFDLPVLPHSARKDIRISSSGKIGLLYNKHYTESDRSECCTCEVSWPC